MTGDEMPTIRAVLDSEKIDCADREGKHDTTCPQCSHRRKKKKLKCLRVWIERQKIGVHCAHCGWNIGWFWDERTNTFTRAGVRGASERPCSLIQQ